MSQDPRIEAADEPSALAFSRQDIRSGKASPVIESLVSIIDSQKRRLNVLAAIDKAATITTVEELDALPVGQRVVLADMLLRRMEEVVDESNWMDLGNGCPVDPETLAMALANVGPARVIHWGTE